ncbi:hypothetical protein [Microcoleus sp. B7-D4]|uniref:hypothetical protein n=1 Tax=Microcoleus sp. B7-D4 TaxID=2818696 RepID=UPI002FD45521
MASLLWSSTSISSFAATNSITSEKFQSDTVKLPVESIPSRQLNLTPDTNLIAGDIRNQVSRMMYASYTFSRFDEIWKNPVDRQKRLFAHCNAVKEFPVKLCFSFLQLWLGDSIETFRDENDFTDMDNIMDELNKMRRNK